jgi:hypothetical protein
MRFFCMLFFVIVYGCSDSPPSQIPNPTPTPVPSGLCEFIEVSSEDIIIGVGERDCSEVSNYIVLREVKKGYIVRRGFNNGI